MSRKFIIGSAIGALALTGVVSSQAAESMLGKGIVLQPTRVTWNTGFSQEKLIRNGLKILGYKVKKAKEDAR